VVLNIPYIHRSLLGPIEASEICLKCGVCCVLDGYSCPVQYDAQFKPTYTYVYDCLGAETPSRNPNIWQCVSCHKCEETCPYEVKPIQFIEDMKQQAFREGLAPESILAEMKQVVTTGYAFPITSNTAKQREALNLEPLKVNTSLINLATKLGVKSQIMGAETNYEI
jgi:heterodisulfide reductase subunit C